MEREKRCKNEEDFRAMYIKIFDTGSCPIHSKEDAALEIWEELIKKEAKFYNKYSYIDVLFDAETKTYYRKKAKGRPPISKSKANRISIRLDDEQLKILDIYCQTNNISERSVVVREAIENYLTGRDNSYV